MTRCPTLLVIGELLNKITMRYHCTHIRIAKIKEIATPSNVTDDKIGSLFGNCWWDIKLCSHSRRQLAFSLKLNMRHLYDSGIQSWALIKILKNVFIQKLNVNNYFVHNNQRTRHNSIVIQWING